MKRFDIEGEQILCMQADVIEACQAWFPEQWYGFYTGTKNTIIVKAKDGRCVYQEFDTDFEKNEAMYEINSITMPEKTADDDNGDWWKKL